jgi:hypothetical protein
MTLPLVETTLQAQFNPKSCAILKDLHISYWHAATAMNFVTVMLHKTIIVPA